MRERRFWGATMVVVFLVGVAAMVTAVSLKHCSGFGCEETR